MEKQKEPTKKELTKKLSSILVVHLDGLNKKKQEKLNIYIEKKLDHVIDYYLTLLKKMQKKETVVPGLVEEIKDHQQ